jgi:hypothetical protein
MTHSTGQVWIYVTVATDTVPIQVRAINTAHVAQVIEGKPLKAKKGEDSEPTAVLKFANGDLVSTLESFDDVIARMTGSVEEAAHFIVGGTRDSSAAEGK